LIRSKELRINTFAASKYPYKNQVIGENKNVALGLAPPARQLANNEKVSP
jgi:hypothetical protein